MPALFAVTLFASALLLFLVQPMVGKMVQPHVGGGPAVWNTCMVFYQALLLCGYWYAHKLTQIPSQRRQVLIHLSVLGVAVSLMLLASTLTTNGSAVPVLKSLAPRGSVFPFFWVIVMLAVAIGAPFFAVSTSAPLLQRWFTATGHPSSRDPYFLYAASNAGSLISLLSYPLFVEPHQKLVHQTWLFAGGFVVLLGLTFLCGRASLNPVRPPTVGGSVGTPPPPPPELWRKWKWVALGFVPSSLMLGITSKLTTDVASMPLLWIIPLTLYLLTFIIAFSRLPKWTRLVLVNLTPVVTLLLVFVETSQVTLKDDLVLLLHVSNFFLMSLLMHGELAHDRPHPKYLTNYFLWISFGGVLGGLFNALIAPIIFPQLYEYPVAIVIGCLLIPAASALEGRADKLAPPEGTPKPAPALAPTSEKTDELWLLSRVLDFVVPVAMMALVGGLIWAAGWSRFDKVMVWTADALTRLMNLCGLSVVVTKLTVTQFVVFAPPCMLCFLFIDRPLRFGLCVLAVLFVHHYREADQPRVKQVKRSYFGILRIDEGWGGDEPEYPFFPPFTHTYQKDGKTIEDRYAPSDTVPDEVTSLSHGTTLHGKQFSRDFNKRTFRDQIRLLGAATPLEALALAGGPEVWDHTKDPLTYYHRTGPVGDMFREAFRRTKLPRVGMVGLGTGSAAAYAVPGQQMTFYEIDRAVRDMIESGDDLSPLLIGKLRDRKARVEAAMRTLVDAGKPADPILDGEYNELAAVLGEPGLGILRAGGKVDEVMEKLERAGVRLTGYTRGTIASAHRSFTYVTDARKRGAEVDIVLGDARLTLEEHTDRKYDLLLIDAFSSDSIPTHLLTVEAVGMYRDRLAANGLLAMHVSNRYLRLEPVVQAIAEELGMACRLFSDEYDQRYGDTPGKTSSSWIVLARSEAELGPAFLDPPPPAGTFLKPGDPKPITWKPIPRHPDIPAWTDDYMDVLRVTRFETLQAVRRLFHLANPVPEWDEMMRVQDAALARQKQ